MQTKIVGITKASLKEHDEKLYKEFVSAMKKATGVTTQKRFYMSEYGYSNSRDVLLGETDVLTKADNYDRFHFDNIIVWWKKYATKRYDKMISEDRLRTKLEVWNENTMNKIDIIR